MKEAKIELYAKDVANTMKLAQHLYIIHETSSGVQTAYRGGPENDRMHTDNIRITKIPYTKEHIDYPKEKAIVHPRVVLARGSDAEIQSYVDKMWATAQEINGEGFDYKLPLIGHVQNSNTAVKERVEAAGLKLTLPTNPDGSAICAPGINGHFTHTYLDTLTNPSIIPNLRSDQYKKIYNPDYSKVSYVNKDTGMKVYQENTGFKAVNNIITVPDNSSAKEISEKLGIPIERIQKQSSKTITAGDNGDIFAVKTYKILPEASYFNFGTEALYNSFQTLRSMLSEGKYSSPLKVYKHCI